MSTTLTHFSQPSRIALALLALSFTVGRLGAEDFSVGPGADCTHQTLQAAIDAAELNSEADLIKLTGALIEDVSVNSGQADQPIDIVGGYPSCSSAVADAPIPVWWGEPGSAPTLEVSGAVGSQIHVNVVNVAISGRDQAAITANGNATVFARSATIYDSVTGVRVTNGAHFVLGHQGEIRDNESTTTGDGGGITCGLPGFPGSGGTVTVWDSIVHNEAIRGGGILAQANCVVWLRGGSEIANNSAELGGAIHLRDSARLDFVRGLRASTFLRYNSANYGGALYVTGAGASAYLGNAWVNSNIAHKGGGAIAVVEDAFLRFDPPDEDGCVLEPNCAVLRSNRLDSELAPNLGSALLVTTQGRAELNRVLIESNGTTEIPAETIAVVGDGSEVFLEGVRMKSNAAQTLVWVDDQAYVRSAFVTIAANWRGLNPVTRPNAFLADHGSDIDLYSSIVIDTTGFPVGVDATIQADCMMVDQPLGGTDVVVGADPHLDPISLRLLPGSPAIDFCDATQFAPFNRDFDGDLRGLDSGSDANTPRGTFDLGADEWNGLFWDGFETGDTSRWSDES